MSKKQWTYWAIKRKPRCIVCRTRLRKNGTAKVQRAVANGWTESVWDGLENDTLLEVFQQLVPVTVAEAAARPLCD